MRGSKNMEVLKSGNLFRWGHETNFVPDLQLKRGEWQAAGQLAGGVQGGGGCDKYTVGG